MKYRSLGHSGVKVSQICLGTMMFGGPTNEADSIRIIQCAIDAGINFLDTANIYTRGTSERMLGEFIAGEREQVVVASKYSMSTNLAEPNCSGNHRKNMVQALEDSLQRLNTDYLDIYWVHGWDQVTRADEVMRALDDLVRAGKVLHVGASNLPAWYIAAANTLAAERNLTPFTALQMHYNLVERSIEAEFFDLAQAHDMALTAWSPLAGGLLTGKFNRDAEQGAADDARLNKAPYGPAMLAEHRLAIAEGLTKLASTIGCEPAQLALAWLLHRRQGSVIPILGARTQEQFDTNMACLDICLNQTQIDELDSLAPPPPTYPASLFQTDFYRTMMHGDKSDQLEP